MAKTAIVYYSKHHGNTKKLLDSIKAYDPNVTLIDVTVSSNPNLSEYDRIGLASGIYYGKFADQVLKIANNNLPSQKEVFFIATAGHLADNNFKSVNDIASSKNCKEIGRFQTKGFDTFGPFKLVGGIQKGHPTEAEIQEAVEFYKTLYGKS